MQKLFIVATCGIIIVGVACVVIINEADPKAKASQAVEQAYSIAGKNKVRMGARTDPWGNEMGVGLEHAYSGGWFLLLTYYVSKPHCEELAGQSWGPEPNLMKINKQKLSSISEASYLCNLNLNEINVSLHMKQK